MAQIGKYGKVELSESEMQFIRDNFTTMTNSQIAKHLALKITIMRTWVYSQGLYKQRMEYWTEEQVLLLKQNYKELGDSEIAEMFASLFNKDKGWTKKHIEKKRRYLGLKRTEEEKKAIHTRNVVNGRFAMCPVNAWRTRGVNPEGTMLKWKISGRIVMMIKVDGVYLHASRVVWERAHGPIPKGMMITYKNQDATDVRLENLDMVSKNEHHKYVINSDRYIASKISGKKQSAEMLNYPDLIELKRKQLQLNRAINNKANDTNRDQGTM